MLLLIDYGTATAKTLLLEEDNSYSLFEISLGFATYTKMTVIDGVRFVLEELEKLSGRSLFEGQKPLCPIYLTGEIASIKLRGMLTAEVEDPAKILQTLEVPFVNAGVSLTVVGDKLYHGDGSSEKISRWLPFKIMEVEIDNYLANRRLFSSVVPTTPRDLEIEQALAQERLRQCLGDSQYREREVYATGAVLGSAPRAALSFLTLINGLSPKEPLKVFLDRRSVLPLLALLKKVNPERFTVIWERERKILMTAGTVVWVEKPGAVQIELEGMAETQELMLSANSLTVFPLGTEVKSRVTLTDGREIPLEGGEVGLVFDTRPRPLVLPDFGRERRELLRQWEQALNVHGEVADLWKD